MMVYNIVKVYFIDKKKRKNTLLCMMMVYMVHRSFHSGPKIEKGCYEKIMCTILQVFTKIVYKNLSKKFKNSAAILNSTFFFKFLAQCESIYNRCTDDEENDITQKGEQLHQPKFFCQVCIYKVPFDRTFP